MKKYKAILFDIDGTLLDTKEFIFQAYMHTLKKHGIKNVSREYLESLGGKTLEEYYNIVAPEIEFELLRESHRIFQSENMHLAVPFEGAVELLQAVKKKGFKIGAVTSRGKKLLIKTLKIAKLFKYFDLIITLEDVNKAKPDPEGILKSLDYFKLKPDEAIFVGDNEVDIEAGKSAGVKTVGVTFGFLGPEIAKLQPDLVIDNLASLREVVISGKTP